MTMFGFCQGSGGSGALCHHFRGGGGWRWNLQRHSGLCHSAEQPGGEELFGTR